MAIPWVKGIQQTAQLTVFPGKGLQNAPAWGDALFRNILAEFNRLAQANQFGVRLVPGANPPDAQGGGSNIQCDVSTGAHSFINSKGESESANLDVSPGTMKGVTYKVLFGPLQKIIRAYVFVPINPVVGIRGRGIGNGPKVGLTLHELLHACGLAESDPGHTSTMAAGDIFMTNAQVQAGFKPDSDKYDFSIPQPDAAGHFVLNTTTVKLVQSVWLLGQF